MACNNFQRTGSLDLRIEWTCSIYYNNETRYHSLTNRSLFLDLNTCEELVCIPAKNIVFSIIPILITFCTIVGNAFIIGAIFSNQKLGEKLTSILICNLAFADLLVGAVITPLAVAQILTDATWLFSRTLCRIWVSMDIILCTASIVNLCVISVDRFIGVMRPLRYHTLVTRQGLIMSAGGIWVFSIAVLLVTIEYFPDPSIHSTECHVGNEQKYIAYGVLLSFFLPLMIIMAMYWKIYKVTKRRERSLLYSMFYGKQRIGKKDIKDQKGQVSGPGGSNLERQETYTDLLFPGLRIHYGGKETSIEKQRNFYKKHKKSAKTLGLVVGAFLCCWLPFFFMYFMDHLCRHCVPLVIFDIFTWLGYANSAINPVIYAITWKTFRQTFLDLIRERNRSMTGVQQTPEHASRPHARSNWFLTAVAICLNCCYCCFESLLEPEEAPVRNDVLRRSPSSCTIGNSIHKYPSTTALNHRTSRDFEVSVSQKRSGGDLPASPVRKASLVLSDRVELDERSLSASSSWMNLKLYRHLISSRATEL